VKARTRPPVAEPPSRSRPSQDYVSHPQAVPFPADPLANPNTAAPYSSARNNASSSSQQLAAPPPQTANSSREALTAQNGAGTIRDRRPSKLIRRGRKDSGTSGSDTDRPHRWKDAPAVPPTASAPPRKQSLSNHDQNVPPTSSKGPIGVLSAGISVVMTGKPDSVSDRLDLDA
jgi:hypothetical protein